MKTVIVLIGLFLCLSYSLSFAAQNNPQIRNCNIQGGTFLAVNTTNDQVGFCQFDKAIVGALDLMLFNNNQSISQSINSYMKNQTACASDHVQTVTIIGTTDTLQVCIYNDGSFIELRTLTKGTSSPDNRKLNDVLGL